MNIFNTISLIGIRQVNSVDFVISAFQVYSSDDVLVILKQSDSGLQLKEERTPKPGGGWLDLRQEVIQEDRPAQIVFTSGTEGIPKAILLSHQALADAVIRLNNIMKLDETVREYIGIPVTYSFGFGRCRAVAAVGGKCFLPENGFNPAELARMIAAEEINAISAVPTLWRTLLVQPEIIGALGSKVKWIEIGSQYMSRAEKEQMKALFPNAVIVQHYGLTEASRTTLLNISETEADLLESVGQATGSVGVKVSPEGLIMIRGPHVATGQIIGAETKTLVDADGWYTTGDFGRLENNYLYYEGRADDLINCAGVKVSPDLLQERINRRLNVENTVAVCRIDDALRGDGFFVAIESGSGINIKEVRGAAIDELLALGINAKSSVKVQEVEHIPRTDTGKVRRKELAKLYSNITAENKGSSFTDEQSSVLDIYTHLFPGLDIKPGDSFRSLGLDSLSYIQVTIELENLICPLPDEWENMSISQLEGCRGSTSALRVLEAQTFLRFLAITLIVGGHFHVLNYGGTGAFLLFMVAGYNFSNFQLPKIIEYGSAKPILGLASKIAILVIPYSLLIQMAFNSPSIPALLFYSNYYSPDHNQGFTYWFLDVYMQILVVLFLLFSLSFVRRLFNNSMYSGALILMTLAILAMVLGPYYWNTEHLFNRVPHMLGWLFFAGILSHQSNTQVTKLISALLFAGACSYYSPDTFYKTILLYGGLLLIWNPKMRVPSWAKLPLAEIAAASLFIYLTHFQFRSLAIKIFGESPVLSLCVALIGGVIGWRLYSSMLRRFVLAKKNNGDTF